MTDPLIGAFVGNYQIVSAIGAGGMARVYRAVHPDIGREVAVKVLSLELAASSDTVRRFKTEAQAVNKIRHPNIVEVFDFGTLPDGRPFYVMELLSGEALADRLRRAGPLPIEEVVAICDPILDALDAAHRAGVVHRDLKPDNVFLKSIGDRVEVKLLDFGIAKLLDDADVAQRTRTGVLMGTPAYMAPEQAAGRVKEIGPRTDVYAVGVMLYQMLSGALPFEADNLGALLLEHLSVVPKTLLDRGTSVSPAVSTLVSRCLAKEPGDRPASARTLRDELRGATGTASLAPTVIAPVPPQAAAPAAAATQAPRTMALPQPKHTTSLSGAAAQAYETPTATVPPRKRTAILVATGAGVVLGAIAITWALARRDGGPARPEALPAIDAAPGPPPPPVDAAPRAIAPPIDAAPRPTPAASAAPIDADIVSRLEKLERLRRDGTITEEEYRRERKKILEGL